MPEGRHFCLGILHYAKSHPKAPNGKCCEKGPPLLHVRRSDEAGRFRMLTSLYPSTFRVGSMSIPPLSPGSTTFPHKTLKDERSGAARVCDEENNKTRDQL